MLGGAFMAVALLLGRADTREPSTETAKGRCAIRAEERKIPQANEEMPEMRGRNDAVDFPRGLLNGRRLGPVRAIRFD